MKISIIMEEVNKQTFTQQTAFWPNAKYIRVCHKHTYTRTRSHTLTQIAIYSWPKLPPQE